MTSTKGPILITGGTGSFGKTMLRDFASGVRGNQGF